MIIDFNINHKVRVKLTQKGRDVLNEQGRKLRNEVPSISDSYRAVPPEDADGWSEWQMWSLINQLGEHCYMGADLPFETGIQIVAEEQQ